VDPELERRANEGKEQLSAAIEEDGRGMRFLLSPPFSPIFFIIDLTCLSQGPCARQSIVSLISQGCKKMSDETKRRVSIFSNCPFVCFASGCHFLLPLCFFFSSILISLYLLFSSLLSFSFPALFSSSPYC
jgi:hypothetical protein